MPALAAVNAASKNISAGNQKLVSSMGIRFPQSLPSQLMVELQALSVCLLLLLPEKQPS